MNRFLLILFQILFTSSFLFAQLVFDKLVIEDEAQPNLEIYGFNFSFKNNLQREIKITKVESTCSCTIPNLEKEIYSPNESGEIKGTFHIEGRTGLQEKYIILHTDNISQPQIKLSLKINILNPVEIKPRLVYWEKNSAVESKNINLTISDPSWKIVSFDCDKTKFTLKSSKKNGIHNIEVTPLSTKESLRDVIKIELKNDKDKTKILAVHALIK